MWKPTRANRILMVVEALLLVALLWVLAINRTDWIIRFGIRQADLLILLCRIHWECAGGASAWAGLDWLVVVWFPIQHYNSPPSIDTHSNGCFSLLFIHFTTCYNFRIINSINSMN